MTSEANAGLVPLKIYRRRDRLTVAAALPGSEPQDIEVEVTADGTLALRGRVRGPVDEGDEVILDEWRDGPFERQVELPAAVDGELANVTYANGVLVVALPLAATTRAATLRMDSMSAAHGERVGSHGSPPAPTTREQHHRRD